MTHDTGLTLIQEDLRPSLAARDGDHVPVLKPFNPVGPATWLITEIGDDGETMFGLCDLDVGCPELGSRSLAELTSVKLPLGLTIERDVSFEGRVPISRWTKIARTSGAIREAEVVVRQLPVINGIPRPDGIEVAGPVPAIPAQFAVAARVWGGPATHEPAGLVRWDGAAAVAAASRLAGGRSARTAP